MANETITPPQATLGLTGFAPTFPSVFVGVPVAILQLNTFPPAAGPSVKITPPVAVLSLTGFAPYKSSQIVPIPVAALTLTAFIPDIDISAAPAVDPEGLIFAFGTYTGDGDTGRQITTLDKDGVEFAPKLVVIKADHATNGNAVMRTDTMSNMRNMITDDDDQGISALNATGFVIDDVAGVAGRTNETGKTYYWYAIGGTLKTGTYLGTGASLPVVDVGFQPVMVWAFHATTGANIAWRNDRMTTNSFDFSNGAGDTLALTSIDVIGFTIGTLAAYNTLGTPYHYIAFPSAKNLDVGLYAGDAAADRQAPDHEVLFQPAMATIKAASNDAVFTTSDLADGTFDFGSTVKATGKINNLMANPGKFRVDADADTNGAATTYFYFMLAATIPAITTPDKGMLFAQGTYTGNGALDRTISFSPKFIPKVVVVKADHATNSEAMILNELATKARNVVALAEDEGIEKLTNGAFTVNDIVSPDGRTNEIDKTYHWFAYGGDNIKVGQYAGTAAEQIIDGVGFTPEMLWVMPKSAAGIIEPIFVRYEGNSPTQDNNATATPAAGTTHTWSHVVSGSGDRTLLVAGFAIDSTTDDVTSVKWDGTDMTLIEKIQVPTSNIWVYLYYITDPAFGTLDIVVETSSSLTLRGGSTSFDDGVIHLPGSNKSATGNDNTPTVVAGIGTRGTGMIIAVAATTEANATWTGGSGETERWDATSATVACTGVTQLNVNASTTINPVFTGGANDWAIIAVQIKGPIPRVKWTPDEGVTWLETILPLSVGHQSPRPTYIRPGVWIICDVGGFPNPKSQTSQSVFVSPAVVTVDGGLTWNDAALGDESEGGDEFGGLADVHVAADGRIWGVRQKGAHTGHPIRSEAWYSDDDGATWTFSTNSLFSVGGAARSAIGIVCHPTDSDIIAFISKEEFSGGDGRTLIRITKDRGASWTTNGGPFPGNNFKIANAMINFRMIMLSSGRLVASNADGDNVPSDIWVSDDDGETWVSKKTEDIDGTRLLLADIPIGYTASKLVAMRIRPGSSGDTSFAFVSEDNGDTWAQFGDFHPRTGGGHYFGASYDPVSDRLYLFSGNYSSGDDRMMYLDMVTGNWTDLAVGEAGMKGEWNSFTMGVGLGADAPVAMRTITMEGDESYEFGPATRTADITALLVDGFKIGSTTERLNTLGQPMVYIAFRRSLNMKYGKYSGDGADTRELPAQALTIDPMQYTLIHREGTSPPVWSQDSLAADKTLGFAQGVSAADKIQKNAATTDGKFEIGTDDAVNEASSEFHFVTLRKLFQVTAADIKLRLSTKSGAAGDTLISSPEDSLGKYISQTILNNEGNSNLLRTPTPSELETGESFYKCFFILNDHATDPALDVAIWVSSDPDGEVWLGMDSTGVTAKGAAPAQALEIADELTAPAGVIFERHGNEASAIGNGVSTFLIGDMQAGEVVAMWVRMRIPADPLAGTRLPDMTISFAQDRQYLRPNKETGNEGAYTETPTGDLHEAIDEEVPDDTDYAESVTSAPTEDEFEVRLSTPPVTPSTQSRHRLRWRQEQFDNGAGSGTVNAGPGLFHGAAGTAQVEVLASVTSTLTETPVTSTSLLLKAAVDLILDYGDLRAQYTADGGTNFSARLTWLEMETPNITVTRLLVLNYEINASPAQEEDALSGADGVIDYEWVLEKRDVNNKLLLDVTEALVSGTFDLNNDRPVKRKCSLKLHVHLTGGVGSDPNINVFGDILALSAKIRINGLFKLYQIALFQLTLPREVFKPDVAGGSTHRIEYEVEGNDLAIRLIEDGPNDPYTILAGANYISGTDGVRDIFNVVGMRHAMPNTNKTLPSDRSWEPGTTWMTIVTDLLDELNMYQPWPTPEGIFITKERNDLDTQTPDQAYKDTDWLIPPFKAERKDTKIYNQVVAVLDDPTQPPISAVATNNDPSSPLSTVALGRTIQRTISVKAEDQPQMQVLAQNLLDKATSNYRTATIRTPFDPRRKAHEVYALTLPEAGLVADKWWCRNWSVGISPLTPMTHRIAHVEKFTVTVR